MVSANESLDHNANLQSRYEVKSTFQDYRSFIRHFNCTNNIRKT